VSCQLLFSLRRNSLKKSSLKTLRPQRPEPLQIVSIKRGARFGGRQPLCGTGVTSRMDTMCNPAAASAPHRRFAAGAGPFIFTSTLFIPYWSRAVPAADKEACCAAYGVPLRRALEPDRSGR